jgi:hypothetical protein
MRREKIKKPRNEGTEEKHIAREDKKERRCK